MKKIPVIDYNKRTHEGYYSTTEEKNKQRMIETQNELAIKNEKLNSFAIDDVEDVQKKETLAKETKEVEKKQKLQCGNKRFTMSQKSGIR